jgi:hypothetical protein
MDGPVFAAVVRALAVAAIFDLRVWMAPAAEANKMVEVAESR